MRKYFIYIFIISLIFTSLVKAEIKRPSIVHKVYFKGSDYELNVYKIFGRKDGKTMLIVGGIQGDEPGGFLSADLYSDIILEKGNLIVVPRANFKSIILFNRGIDGDMNRIFNKKKINSDMDRVVEIIKRLMSQSDVFLHLHDGWGYHYPTYINRLRNPKRFGESIITDADEFKCLSGKKLNLKKWAESVIQAINSKIENKKYFFHYFNTHTDSPSTPFKDMRKTATYYALKNFCIPAFGIETSKNLPNLKLKIRFHNYAVNAFMELFGIIPEQPRIFLPKPLLKYVVIQINNKPQIVTNGETIYIPKNSMVQVIHIESNYKRGLSCDFLGIKGINNSGIPVEVKKDTKVIFRKDSKVIGRIFLKLNNHVQLNNWVFIISINGKKKAVLNKEKITLKKGDILKLIKVFSENVNGEDIKINFKGFVPSNKSNNGDDRGYKIVIGNNLIKKYSIKKDREIFPIVATKNNNILATFYIEIKQ